ncbi:Carboxylesterase patB [Lachnellula suecica]|uniref:Carboxylic ester hydrolase n=1 Tax=Lachnellula suecica TaxID=602035 RepID=A0A8T9C339_9HELO|nr:Carboxylesterase patB [Lachnellula suecica]
MKFSIFVVIAACSLGLSTPYNPRPFDEAHLKPRASTNATAPLQVDLGYAVYKGFNDNTTGLNLWRGIRFAAPPIGNLRWQEPQPPLVNRTSVTQATDAPNQCPQGPPNLGGSPFAVAPTPLQSEDCLFLNIFAPPNAENLPVLFYIHGGGYGAGNGETDLSEIINTNNGSFIGVAIQYRLGAFGFLSSDEVDRFGTVNAGIRDQVFALQWAQRYIRLFGGDPGRVTIAGESAGGGSVMLQAMAFGGELGSSLWTNAIAASPYLPMQYKYNAWVPSQAYYAFALKAGCFPGFAEGSLAVASTIFQCLVGKDTETLMNASASIGASGPYGTWGFLPVTDGTLIRERPTEQLSQKKVNGLRILSGNNADEGAIFVQQNITTEETLVSWLKSTFPLFKEDDINKLLLAYPSSNDSDPANPEVFATLGYTGPTAVNQSSLAVGQQQRANNIYAETTFVCPSYWLVEAFPISYKYQYSVPAATHASDVTGYFGPAAANQGPEFLKAFMGIWGNFVTQGNPSIPDSLSGNESQSLANWPGYTIEKPLMVNLNETGGEMLSGTAFSYEGQPVTGTSIAGPGLMNNFSIVDAGSWEGGRGARCDFWQSMGRIVPE